MCCDPFLETKKGIATANPSYVQWGFLLISYAFSIPDLPTDANFCRVFSAGKKKNRQILPVLFLKYGNFV